MMLTISPSRPCGKARVKFCANSAGVFTWMAKWRSQAAQSKSSTLSSTNSDALLTRSVTAALSAVNPDLTWTFRPLADQIDGTHSRKRYHLRSLSAARWKPFMSPSSGVPPKVAELSRYPARRACHARLSAYR